MDNAHGLWKQGESKEHVALEIMQVDQQIENNPNMTSYIRGKLEAISFSCCIFGVPNKFKEQNEGAYCPKMVSIGPSHHGKDHLQHMEHHKWEYLNSLLGRSLNLDTILNSCIKALQELEPKIRACYQEDFSCIQSQDFLTMILVDSGFIIELFLRYSIRGLRRREDSLFRSPEKFHLLRNDLILLDNQLPFFVLRKIFSLVPLDREWSIRSLSHLTLRFFKNMILGDIQILEDKYSFEGSSHLLDFIWKCHLPSYSKVPMGSGTGLGKDIHSASKLKEEGIKVRSIEAESILDVRFINGELLIPRLKIHNYMETMFRNMIAWEHIHSHHKMMYATSYVYLMKGLIQSNNDVHIFSQRDIFLNNSYIIERKEEVISLFKNLLLSEEVDLEKFYYEGMWEQVMSYKRTKWDLRCFSLKRKYKDMYQQLGNRMFGFIIAIVVLILIGALGVIIYYIFMLHRRDH